MSFIGEFLFSHLLLHLNKYLITNLMSTTLLKEKIHGSHITELFTVAVLVQNSGQVLIVLMLTSKCSLFVSVKK